MSMNDLGGTHRHPNEPDMGVRRGGGLGREMGRVLIACEFSGIVRDAFIAAGHDAVSCDLLPSERPGPHIQDDVLRHLDCGWDLMIAHPPCTYLANSGVRWLYGGKGAKRASERWAAMESAADFFARLLAAPIPHVMVENPIMHGHGHDRVIRRAADYAGGWIKFEVQTVQPWQFGHGETKATQLWTRNLPALIPTNIVPGRQPRVHHASPGPDRWKERSRTLPGIAAAMAEQWGAAVLAATPLAPTPASEDGLPIIDSSHDCEGCRAQSSEFYVVNGGCFTCGQKFRVKARKGDRLPLSVECPTCEVTEYSWRAAASRDTGVVEGAGLDLRIEQERRSAFLAAQEAVRLLSPRSKAIGTIGHMVARADAAIARLATLAPEEAPE